MRLPLSACLCALAVLGTPAAAQTAQRRADLGGLSRSLQSVVARVSPAVVQIQVVAYGPLSAGAAGNTSLLGTQRNTGSALS